MPGRCAGARLRPENPSLTVAAGATAAPAPPPQPTRFLSRSVSVRRLGAVLLPLLCMLWLWVTRYPPIAELRSYLIETERRRRSISTRCRRAGMKRRCSACLRITRVRCLADDSGMPGIERVCTVYLESLNGVPTMWVNFMFSASGLSRVAWRFRYGPIGAAWMLWRNATAPTVTQQQFHSGIRLHGWLRADGSALFYNRDRELNPLSARFNGSALPRAAASPASTWGGFDGSI